MSGLPIPGSAADRPNILFVVTDDVGVGDIRSYNPDGKVTLPTIESIAREGIRFTDAHTTASKCAPSRYSIMTGNYHWRGRKSWGQWNYKGGSQVIDGQQTLGSLLQRAGYRTSVIGKYHLGADFYRRNSDAFASEGEDEGRVDFGRQMADGPGELGFDSSFLLMRGIQASPYAYFLDGELVGSPDALIRWEVGDYGDTRIDRSGIGHADWNTREVGPTLLSQALGFIDDHYEGQAGAQVPAPFFLYFNTQAVHDPYKPPISIGETPVLDASGLSKRADLLVETDAILDTILRDLEQRKQLENTLIIFTSDNGGLRRFDEVNRGHRVSAEFRGDKGTIYEGGHRVPLIIKWGSKSFGESSLPQGSAVGKLVGIHDIYATLAELTGVPLREDEALDSLSFLPILMGRQAALDRTQMVFEADEAEDNAPDGGIPGNHFAIRTGDFKLILDDNGAPFGLYDLAADPGESENLVNRNEQRARVTEMRSELQAVLASERTAPLPLANMPPAVTILAPANDTAYFFSETVVFAGDANDTEDGQLSDLIEWQSNIDGDIGIGASVSLATLQLGVHTITASVVDSVNSAASTSIEISILNNSPAVSIAIPEDGTTAFFGETIVFEAEASDIEDGELSDYIEWRSSIDGEFAVGDDVSLATLQLGDHTISASVVDSGGASATSNIQISIINNPPELTITSPENGSSVEVGSDVVFAGNASDVEDGSLSDLIDWRSSIDGALGTGQSITLSDLAVGEHTISAGVTDSLGESVSRELRLTVVATPAPLPPPRRPTQTGSGGGGAIGLLEALMLLWLALLVGASRTNRSIYRLK